MSQVCFKQRTKESLLCGNYPESCVNFLKKVETMLLKKNLHVIECGSGTWWEVSLLQEICFSEAE